MKKGIFRKIIAIVVALVMVVGAIYVLPAEKAKAESDYTGTYPVCVVAGTENLTGASWNANVAGNEANLMTESDGIFKKVYTNVQPGSYSYKVVKYSSADGNAEWIGIDGNNVAFTVETACDVTITYNLATGGISTQGEGLVGYKLKNMSMAGSAALFGAEWEHVSMTETSEGSNVWVYTVSDVPKGTYSYKYTADNDWAHSWGTGGYYNGSNCEITVGAQGGTVTFEVDLNGIDFSDPSKVNLGNAATYIVTFGAYAVEFEVGDNIIVENGEETVQAGAEYRATLKAKDGYKLPESINIQVDGSEFEEYEYNRETGEICITMGTIDGPVVIMAEAEENTAQEETTEEESETQEESTTRQIYTVEFEVGDNIIITYGPDTVERGGEYYAVLEAKEGYELPENIIVKVNGVEIDEYGYIQETGQICVIKSATVGDILIIAEAVEITTEEETTVEATTEEETTVEVTTEEETTVVAPKEKTYNVVGAAGLCGSSWDLSSNQMTKNNDGTWSKEFTNIVAGTYDFKVAENGSWDVTYNCNGEAKGDTTNAKVTVEKDGSTVIIGFDGSKATVKVVAPEATTEEKTTTKAPETTTEEKTTTKAPETTTEEKTTTKTPETTTEKETTTEEETTKVPEATEEETTTKASETTEEETTTKAPETTTEEETTTKAPETTTEKETTTVQETTTEKPSVNTKEEGKNSAPEAVEEEKVVEPEKLVDTAVQKMEDADVKTVEVISPKPQTLTKEVFDAIKSEGKNLTVGVTDEKNQLQYSWTFSNKIIDNTNMNIDLTITLDSEKKEEISKITGSADATYITFAHHGKLPGAATIKTYVGDKYKNGDVVYLYYFNEEDNKILMVGNKALAVKGGYVEYTITHCSTYFLLEEKLEGVAKDADSLDDANVSVVEPESVEETTTSTTTGTAKPGDTVHVMLWFAVISVALGVVVFGRKKNFIEE